MKATVIANHQGRSLWTDGLRPGRMHDATAVRLAVIGRCFPTFDRVQVLLDDGYLGLSRDHRVKALTQPHKLRPGATLPFLEHNEHQRHDHSSQRITVEHALADHKRWKQLARWTHRRENLPDTYQAIAALVSDRNHRLKKALSRANVLHSLSRTNSLSRRKGRAPNRRPA